MSVEILDQSHFLSDEEEGSPTPLTERPAFKNLPSDEEVQAVLGNRACFIPRSSAMVSDVLGLWRDHLLSCGYPLSEVNREYQELLDIEFSAIMNRSNADLQRNASRELEIPIKTLAGLRKELKPFQLPTVAVEALRNRLSGQRN